MRRVISATIPGRSATSVLTCGLLAAVGGLICFAPSNATAQEAQWIWSAKQTADIPLGSCYFRKTFELGTPESGEVQITADDAYELLVNNRRVGMGKNWKTLDYYDISKFLITGKNTIAVKVTHSEGATAGLAARLVVKSTGDTHISHSTDESWKTSLEEEAGWIRPNFDDSRWLAAYSFGSLGKAKPWGDEVRVAAGSKTGRFQVTKDFRIEAVIPPKETGSVVAMAFDEFGSLVLAREEGPLLIVRDENKDGVIETARIYSEKIKNCQGILPLNGMVYAVGEGPDGAGLYRLSEPGKLGRLQKIETLIKFPGGMAEHGPHQLVLGPDGLIYIVLGNHAEVAGKIDRENSPYHQPYEGDLVTPRYEDMGMKGKTVPAPGGTVIRTDADGGFVEIYAGGLRNAYDIAFNRNGELFTHDSDMEWDIGLPWYRPTRVNHVTAGSEFGWRSGWAVWPDYYVDSLGSVCDTGRGSPTGMTFYNHTSFPPKYQDTMFVGDWSRGRIIAVHMKPEGGSYTATSEVFVEGRPLNITDLAVGPDGWLYFCTGGRGTEGGVYRVVWKGNVPDDLARLRGVEAAVRQPQLEAAWARQRVAGIKQRMGEHWAPEITKLALDANAKPDLRVRALDLMQLLGPFPESDMLVKLSADANEQVRAKSAFLMGIHFDQTVAPRLSELLADADPNVVRVACEATVRAGHKPPLTDLLPALASKHRSVAFAARRVLEQIPRDQWQQKIVAHQNLRVFIQGSIALLTLDADKATAKSILDRCNTLLDTFIGDEDFTDLLRVMQVALARGEFTGKDVPALRDKLAEEYPAQEWKMNRELVRLLVHLQAGQIRERMLEQLRGDLAMPDKLQIALHARYLDGWTTDQKFELLKFFESSRALSGGNNYAVYIENISRDFFAKLSASERGKVLADAPLWPSSALSVLATLGDLSDEQVEQLIQLDGPISKIDTDAASKLGVGIVAVLGNSGHPKAMTYLRELFDKEPNRRGIVAMGLAQQPNTENWPYLIRSLPVVEGVYAQEVLTKLAASDIRPDKPEAVRQVILQGLKLGDEGGKTAITLLEKWSAQRVGKPDDSIDVAMLAWQKWFATKYPSEPEAKLPVDAKGSKWTFDELATYLSSPEGKRGMALRGEALFAKAQCIRCHRYGERGEGVGPDLTNVSKRFQQKEILESILYPSAVISDQYVSKIVQTIDGRSLAGLVSTAADGSLIVLQSDGNKIMLAADNIESTTTSKKSVMPEGLLNSLTQEQIADLFAYLGTPPSTVSARRQPINAER